MSKKKRSSLKNLRENFQQLSIQPKTKSKKKTPHKSLGDVTLNDFANSPVVKTRSKKSNNDIVNTLNDIEIIEDDDDLTFKSFGNSKKKSIKKEIQLDTGIQYPIDIWHILSNYIRPQDIGRFAGICKASNDVVHSATFWFAIYKRYYKTTLSEPLQPHNLRTYGLRSIVVRAIHEVHPFYIEYRKLHDNRRASLQPIKNTKCILCWYRFKSSFHIYAFKLHKKNFLHNQSTTYSHRHAIYANSEEDYIVFLVLSQNLIPLPQILGLTLTSATFQTNGDVFQKYGTLDLCFTCPFSPIDSASSVRIKLDRVVHFEILNWWHPNYPFNFSMKVIRDDEEE